MARVLLDDGDVQALYADGVRATNPLFFVKQLVAAARTPGALDPGTEPSYVLAVAADLCEELGDHEQALALIKEAIETDLPDPAPLYRYARRAELLILSGRHDEGMRELEALRPRLGSEVTSSAIIDALEATGQLELAVDWLTDAIRRMLPQYVDLAVDGEEAYVFDRLIGQRRRIRHELGLEPDALDLTSDVDPAMPFDSALAPSLFRQDDDYGEDDPVEQAVLTGLVFWPEDQYAALVARWPDLAEGYGGDWSGHRAAYKLQAEGHPSTYLQVVRGEFEEFLAHAAERDLDPATGAARASYAAELARRGLGIDYPPERNAPCWCGSGSKYKKCCGFG
jgi:tetratricopeptide (TPR) repeat protein